MSQDFNAGQRLGDYEILSVLGAGGMGKVYKVRNVISDRTEAMKILLPNLSSQQELADRFLREIKLLASLNHPNIAQLRTALTIQNQLVMIMEFVDGSTIASRLQNGALPPVSAVSYVDQVLAALSYAHKMNIVHRDVKPANMMVTPQGVVKLMDFGIARSASDRGLTMTGTTLGSLNYMPPEQVKGDPADARSDLYSLGVSLYEMVTGRLPFEGDSSYSLMAAHLNEQPKPPIMYRADIPDALNQIILIALQKDPGQRFQSADAFRNALKSVSGGARVATQPATPAVTPAPRQQPMPETQETLVEPPVHAVGGSATALFSQGSNDNSATVLPDAPPPVRPSVSTPAPLFAAAPGASQALRSSVTGSSAGAPAIPAAASRSHRGVYVALGGLLVVGCLAAAAFVLPRRAKTRADANKSSFSTQAPPASSAPSTPQAPADPSKDSVSVSPSGITATSTNPDGSTSKVSVTPGGGVQVTGTPPPSTSVPSGNPDENQPDAAQPTGGVKPPVPTHRLAPRGNAQAPTQSQADSRSGANSGARSQQAQAAEDALAEEVEKQNDQVGSRVEAASQSIDNLKREQEAQGYGLRGDIVSSQERMNTYYAKAQAALQNQDPKSAKKYLDLAETELEKLEKFLGH
ncbi:MAG TPA: protein kinase [Terriglobales bacterium]|nr:protein kinase [Terriglobales bacterium]